MEESYKREQLGGYDFNIGGVLAKGTSVSLPVFVRQKEWVKYDCKLCKTYLSMWSDVFFYRRAFVAVSDNSHKWCAFMGLA